MSLFFANFFLSLLPLVVGWAGALVPHACALSQVDFSRKHKSAMGDNVSCPSLSSFSSVLVDLNLVTWTSFSRLRFRLTWASSSL